MLQIDHLTRDYDGYLAVDDVSFSIEKGEIAGLLGHNGAGKTTIMKMISGYLEPSSGRIEIEGMDIARQRTEVQRRIGYLPETLPIYPEMSVADYLDYAARLKGLPDATLSAEIRRVVESTDIGARLLAPIATLSRGYKQRLGVAQAILGNPRLLILDEPTNGLDPTQTQHMRDLIKALASEATVILSTHIMQEVDAICDRVLILRSGELALDATLADLRHSNRVAVGSDIDSGTARDLLLPLDGVEDLVPESKGHFLLTLGADSDPNAVCNRVAITLIERGHSLYELRRQQRDLESVFREASELPGEEVRHAA
ncbi:MAG TPA: ABC transporter ATP-binding protein [Gammaproteobacteria bacterium]|nr:ABC transporter ATP-binding protein [Gammaproteobacteria bacterium]